jgi:hypothetical protein
MPTLTIKELLETFPGSRIIDGPRPLDPFHHAKDFLETFYGNWQRNLPGQWLEIRLIRSGSVQQRFYHCPAEFIAGDLPKLLSSQAAEGFNVYFGVCPRSRRSGRNEDIKLIPALWADIDQGGSPGKLMALNPKPDLLVFSGRGYHAYWKLKSPVPANERTQKTLRSIQKACGSDSVSDFARVMRLPGSLNMKDPQDPKRCKVLYGL